MDKSIANGYFGIGIFHGKNSENIGTLFRSAINLGADFIFTIGKRYDVQSSDTQKAFRKIPLFNFKDYNDFREHIPYDCRLIGIEIDDRSKDLFSFTHPSRCVYLLGAEDHGIPPEVLEKCQEVVSINTKGCMNVSVTGSIVMYDRMMKNTLCTRESTA